MGRVGRLRVPDRRRRGASGRVRTALLDAVARTEGLGLTVVGVYDASIFASTSSWVDARGATSGGPTITLTGSPTLSNGVYTFNGTDQYGRNASAGRLSEITDGICGLVVVHEAFTPAANALVATASASTTNLVYGGISTTPQLLTGTAGTGTTSVVAATAANGTVIVQHAWRTATDIAARLGAGTAATATPTTFTATALSRLTIAANASGTPGSLAPAKVRTVVVIKGTHSAAAQAIWNQYGVLRGATV